MMDKTNTGSEAAHIREPIATTAVTLGVNVDNTTSQQVIDFNFDRLNGVSTALIEDVSSTETSPIREPAPAINPTEINTLLNRAEKVKAKVECEISLPKA